MQRYGRQRQPARIIQIIPVPMPVTAVYGEPDGTESTEPVRLIGLDDEGNCSFLTVDDVGIFDCPDEIVGFLRYEFDKGGSV